MIRIETANFHAANGDRGTVSRFVDEHWNEVSDLEQARWCIVKSDRDGQEYSIDLLSTGTTVNVAPNLPELPDGRN